MITPLYYARTVFFNAQIASEINLTAQAAHSIELGQTQQEFATVKTEEIIQIQLGAAPVKLEL